MMDQQPIIPESQPKPTNRGRKFGIIALIVLAVIVIAASAFALMNPNGIETADDAKSGSVTIDETSLAPSTINIKQGESVTWTNTGATPRSLVMTSSGDKQSVEGFGSDEPMTQDESYSFTFDTKGTFTYEDTTAPEQINGTIIVE